jgi:hypothetical protein
VRTRCRTIPARRAPHPPSGRSLNQGGAPSPPKTARRPGWAKAWPPSRCPQGASRLGVRVSRGEPIHHWSDSKRRRAIDAGETLSGGGPSLKTLHWWQRATTRCSQGDSSQPFAPPRVEPVGGSSWRGAQGPAGGCPPLLAGPKGAKDGPSFFCGAGGSAFAERDLEADVAYGKTSPAGDPAWGRHRGWTQLAPPARLRTAHRRRTGFEAAPRTSSTNAAAPLSAHRRAGLRSRDNPTMISAPVPPGGGAGRC